MSRPKILLGDVKNPILFHSFIDFFQILFFFQTNKILYLNKLKK
jgi:hypothetical protein